MIKVLSLAGTARSIGRQHGEQVVDLRPYIQASMQTRLAVLRQQGVNLFPYLEEIIQIWQQHAPATLEMLLGIAEALEFDWRDYLSYTIFPYLEGRINLIHRAVHQDQGCTTWAASGVFTHDGAPLLVKNRDNHPDQRPLQCLAHVRPERGYPYLCLTTAGIPGVSSSGINTVGLAVVDTYVASTDVGPGIGRYSVMMDLLEKCASVRDAIVYIRSHPHFGNGTVSLVDAQGDMAVFEIAHSVLAVRHPNEGFVVSTNHFTAPKTRTIWMDCEQPHLQGNSVERHGRVEKALRAASGRVDIPWAQNLMAQHGTGLSAICRHAEIDPLGVTISCVILLPRQASIYVANGHPCQTPFELVRVAD